MFWKCLSPRDYVDAAEGIVWNDVECQSQRVLRVYGGEGTGAVGLVESARWRGARESGVSRGGGGGEEGSRGTAVAAGAGDPCNVAAGVKSHEHDLAGGAKFCPENVVGRLGLLLAGGDGDGGFGNE